MNKDCVRLPFETKPLLNHYHYIAFPMGIIQANAKEDITPWLCGRYVNCVFNPDPYQNNIEISLFDRWGTADKILDGQNISLFNETYKLLEIDLISLLKSGQIRSPNPNEQMNLRHSAYALRTFLYFLSSNTIRHTFTKYGLHEF